MAAAEWRNWAGDQACRPVERLSPRNRDELAAAVAAAAEAGRKVSVAGSGHSFTEAAMTDGTLIDIGALGGVIDADPASGLVKVGAGATLADLNEELDRLGLAMENLGDIDRQTVAGAISTGTHGTGVELRQPLDPGRRRSSWSRPTARSASSTTPSPNCCGRRGSAIGALGAISAVTLRCVPAFTLQMVSRPRAAGGGAEHLRRAGRGQRPLRALHLSLRGLRPRPRTRPDRLASRARGGSCGAYLNDIVLENWALGAFSAATKAIPATIPGGSTARGAACLGRQGHRPQRPDLRHRAPGPVHRDGVRECHARAGPRPPAGWSIGSARTATRSSSRSRCGSSRATTPCSAPRTSATPPTSRSTSTGGWSGGPTSKRSRRSWTPTAAARTGASATSRRAETLRPRYPRWDEFAAARDQLDPGRVFANEYAERVLGP